MSIPHFEHPAVLGQFRNVVLQVGRYALTGALIFLCYLHSSSQAYKYPSDKNVADGDAKVFSMIRYNIVALEVDLLMQTVFFFFLLFFLNIEMNEKKQLVVRHRKLFLAGPLSYAICLSGLKITMGLGVVLLAAFVGFTQYCNELVSTRIAVIQCIDAFYLCVIAYILFAVQFVALIRRPLPRCQEIPLLPLSGYVEDMETCSICMNAPVSRELVPCGHRICCCCFVKLWKTRVETICPFCRSIVETARFLSVVVGAPLTTLNTCPHSDSHTTPNLSETRVQSPENHTTVLNEIDPLEQQGEDLLTNLRDI